MLQHTSSEVTVGGKNANKYKRNVKDWYTSKRLRRAVIHQPLLITLPQRVTI